jgi:hypothetical protein
LTGVVARLDRQFEFIKTEWINEGCSSAHPTNGVR